MTDGGLCDVSETKYFLSFREAFNPVNLIVPFPPRHLTLGILVNSSAELGHHLLLCQFTLQIQCNISVFKADA